MRYDEPRILHTTCPLCGEEIWFEEFSEPICNCQEECANCGELTSRDELRKLDGKWLCDICYHEALHGTIMEEEYE